MRLILYVIALVAAGCSFDQTAVLLTITPASMQPDSLRITLFGDRMLTAPRQLSLAGHPLPGSILITHLDANTPDFRVLVDGLDDLGVVEQQGAQAIPLIADAQISATVHLQDGKLADSDGDGIPDLIDDCPVVPDADQQCRAAVADAAVDLKMPAGADLAGADLKPPPDLAVAVDLAGADLRPVVTCPPGALFCDDFESGDTSKWTGTQSAGGITFTVDGAHPLNGTHALHVHTTGGSNTAWLRYVLPTAVTSGPVSLRAFIYSPAAFTAPLYFYFLHRDGGDDDYVAGLDTISGSEQWTVYNKNPGNFTTATGSFSAGAWHCVEFEVDVAAVDLGVATNTVKLYVDGNAPAVWPQTAADSTTLIGEMDVGVTYQNVGAGIANDFFVDDVALATSHIGCE